MRRPTRLTLAGTWILIAGMAWAADAPVKERPILRSDRVLQNKKQAQDIVNGACSSLGNDQVAVHACLQRGRDFLEKYPKVPCRSVFFDLYKYNLMNHLCKNLVFDDSKESHGKANVVTRVNQLYGNCYFSAFENAFPVKVAKGSTDESVMDLGKRTQRTSPDFWSRYPILLGDPCMKEGRGSSGYRICFSKFLENRTDTFHTYAVNFPKMLETKSVLGKEDPEPACGMGRDLDEDLRVAIASRAPELFEAEHDSERPIPVPQNLKVTNGEPGGASIPVGE